jgi:hypothetical protein
MLAKWGRAALPGMTSAKQEPSPVIFSGTNVPINCGVSIVQTVRNRSNEVLRYVGVDDSKTAGHPNRSGVRRYCDLTPVTLLVARFLSTESCLRLLGL